MDKPEIQPGLVRLPNIGNSCYMNSILQIITSIPEMRNFLNEANFRKKITKTVSALVKKVSDSKSKTEVSPVGSRYWKKSKLGRDLREKRIRQ